MTYKLYTLGCHHDNQYQAMQRILGLAVTNNFPFSVTYMSLLHSVTQLFSNNYWKH